MIPLFPLLDAIAVELGVFAKGIVVQSPEFAGGNWRCVPIGSADLAIILEGNLSYLIAKSGGEKTKKVQRNENIPHLSRA